MWQSHGCGVAEGRGRSGTCSPVEVKRTWRKGRGGGGWGEDKLVIQSYIEQCIYICTQAHFLPQYMCMWESLGMRHSTINTLENTHRLQIVTCKVHC